MNEQFLYDQYGAAKAMRGNFFGHPVNSSIINEVTFGNIKGMYGEIKFFRNPNVPNGGIVDIWDMGGQLDSYVYTAEGGADYFIASTDPNDTQIIRCHILDENYLMRWVDVQLNGQTPVQVNLLTWDFVLNDPKKENLLSFNCLRIYRLVNLSPTPLLGEIYCAEGNAFVNGVPNPISNTRAHINVVNGVSNNVTLMSQYTIPKNMYGYVFQVSTSVFKKNAASIDATYWGRSRGGQFTILDTHGYNTLGLGGRSWSLAIPYGIPPETDIVARVEADATCGVSGLYGFILVNRKLVEQVSLKDQLDQS